MRILAAVFKYCNISKQNKNEKTDNDDKNDFAYIGVLGFTDKLCKHNNYSINPKWCESISKW